MHFKRTADIDPIFSYQESFVQVLCYIYAYELILGLHVFRQTEPTRQIDCLTRHLSSTQRWMHPVKCLAQG